MFRAVARGVWVELGQKVNELGGLVALTEAFATGTSLFAQKNPFFLRMIENC